LRREFKREESDAEKELVFVEEEASVVAKEFELVAWTCP
jgi:hypothetical protein